MDRRTKKEAELGVRRVDRRLCTRRAVLFFRRSTRCVDVGSIGARADCVPARIERTPHCEVRRCPWAGAPLRQCPVCQHHIAAAAPSSGSHRTGWCWQTRGRSGCPASAGKIAQWTQSDKRGRSIPRGHINSGREQEWQATQLYGGVDDQPAAASPRASNTGLPAGPHNLSHASSPTHPPLRWGG